MTVIGQENSTTKRVARTRFASLGRREAIVVLVLVGVLMWVCWKVGTRERLARPELNGEPGDLVFYQTVLRRVHGGEGYYEVMAGELRVRGYGMQSVFNWRTPMLMWGLAKLPDARWGRWIMSAVALMTIVLVRIATRRQSEWIVGLAAPLVVFYAGLIGCFAKDGMYFSELWAGLFILLSIVLYSLGWRGAALAIAVLSLFIRELAGLYVVICIVMAVREKRWREVAVWAAALTVYGIYYGLHVAHTHRVLLPTDPADPRSWLEFGGLRFVLQTAWWSGVAIKPPDWVIAVYFPVAMLGLLALPQKWGRLAAITGFTYALFFCVVGHVYNDYWGMIYCPILALGAVWGIVAMRDLVRRAL